MLTRLPLKNLVAGGLEGLHQSSRSLPPAPATSLLLLPRVHQTIDFKIPTRELPKAQATASLLNDYLRLSIIFALIPGTPNTERQKTNAKLASRVDELQDVSSYAASDKQTSSGRSFTETDRSVERRAVE